MKKIVFKALFPTLCIISILLGCCSFSVSAFGSYAFNYDFSEPDSYFIVPTYSGTYRGQLWFWAITPVVDSNNSKVEPVVSVDVSGFTNNIGTDSVVRLYDEEDKIVASNSIVKNISKVRVNVEILELKTVAINWNTSGVAASGYQATGEITATKDSVVIAGKSKVVDNISAIEIPETALDITGATENVETILDLEDYLPDGVILAEEDFNGKVLVTVYVEPTIEKTVTMKTEEIQIINMPEGFEGKILEDEEEYEIILVGLASNLNALDVETLQATIDVMAWMESEEMEEMSPNYYTVNLTYNLENGIALKEDVSVKLYITEKEE